MKKNRLLHILANSPLSYLLSLGALLILLEIVCYIFKVPEYILPAPSKVIPYLVTNLFSLRRHFQITFMEIILGFIVGWIIAFILATGVVFYPLLGTFIRPIIVLSQTIPVITIAPIIIVWFGFGIQSKVVTSALLVIFPVFIGIIDGFQSVPPNFLDFMKATRASRFQIFYLIQIPQAIPNLITSTKIGITLSVIGAIIGEFITAEYGIGLVIRQAINELNKILSFAMIYVLGFVGVQLYSLLDIVELILEKKYRKIGKGGIYYEK